MKAIITKIILGVAYLLLVLFGSQVAYAECTPKDTKTAITCGANGTSGVPVSAQPDQSLTTTLKVVIQYLSIAIGIAAVIMIMFGGFRLVASAGNDAAIKSARSTITYALIGLVIAALAQIVVHFVLNKING